MKSKTKHFASFAVLVLFTVFALSSRTSKINNPPSYWSNGQYYLRIHGMYGQRIVAGKINLYFTQEVTSTRTFYEYYAQAGEGAPLISLEHKKEIMKMLEGCPVALQMAEKRLSHFNDNRNIMNEVFEVYNTDCK